MKHDINTVIEAGQELFQSKGYFNTGTEEILEKSGFASQVLENYGESAAAFYRDQLFGDATTEPLDRIWSFVEKMVDLAIERNFKTECLVQKFSIECAGMNESLREVTRKQINKILDVLEECIVEGQH